MKSTQSSTLVLGSIAVALSTGLFAQPSKAGTCPGILFNANLCPAGWNTVTSGGASYTISNIVFNSPPANADALIFSGLTGTNVNLQYNLNPTISSSTSNFFTYTIQLNTPGYTFNRTQSNATGSDLSGGTYSTTTSNPVTNYFLPRTADPTSNPSPNTTIAAGLTSLNIQQAFSNTNPATLSSIGANYTAVPAPLPIAGLGLAYGMSRKLRRRIRQAV